MVHQLVPFEERVVHVRFAGQSWDIALALLDLSERSNDRQVRRALARYLEVPERKLALYAIERHANGNITLRPEAVFG
jgi:hypothetical protein